MRSDHQMYEWRGFKFTIYGDRTWAYVLSTDQDPAYRGCRPPDEVVKALDCYLQHNKYGGLGPVEYLDKVFG